METYRKQVNHELPSYMNVARLRIIPEEFEKTPKKSIKRYLYTVEV
jgi:long-chain acyl-CoA synthetase